jgi:putative DNA primase/helicase
MSIIREDDSRDKPTATKQIVAYALDYAKRGIPVFPCKRKDKSPLTPHGFKDATTNRKKIMAWWDRNPQAMIGVPTGSKSGIDVIDIDLKKDEYVDGFRYMPDWKKMSPVIVRTPSGGAHLYYKSDGKVRNTTDAIAPGIDTRGDGGYVIVPPSSNIKGAYKFVGAELGDPHGLPVFPADMLEKLEARHDVESGDDPEAEPHRIAAAMDVIPNNDVGWEDWNRFGMAIYRASGGGRDGLEVFDAWSQKSKKYDEQTTLKKWETLKRSPPTRIGAGTIFYEADKIDRSWRTKGLLVLDKGAPLQSAKEFVRAHFTPNGQQGLGYHKKTFYEWCGTHWRQCDLNHLRSQLYEFLDKAVDDEGRPFNPTSHKVNEIIDALQAGVEIDARLDAPFWLDNSSQTSNENLIACRNGLLDPVTLTLIPHDPKFFNVNSLPYDYDPNAPEPSQWIRFLKQLWPNKEDGRAARETLQEMFGLFLTADTSQQKIFMLVGPPRGGRGTIGRVLNGLLGPNNVSSPTIGSLSGEFGMWPLIDKRLAIISDARAGNKGVSFATLERLLSVSGEDPQSVNRKNLSFWQGRLKARFLIMTNELPRVSDQSGAFVARIVLLTMTKSWLGKEDTELTNKLLTELPGILNWSLRGLARLRRYGSFEMPQSSSDALQRLTDLTSPIQAFIRDWCERTPDQRINTKLFYTSWKYWCEQQGIPPGSAIVFGRDLHTRCPEVKPGGKGADRFYRGIGLSQFGQKQYDKLSRMAMTT